MTEQVKSTDLARKTVDYLVSAAKAALGKSGDIMKLNIDTKA